MQDIGEGGRETCRTLGREGGRHVGHWGGKTLLNTPPLFCRLRASFLDHLEAWKFELTSKTEETVAGKVCRTWVCPQVGGHSDMGVWAFWYGSMGILVWEHGHSGMGTWAFWYGSMGILVWEHGHSGMGARAFWYGSMGILVWEYGHSSPH